MGTKTIGLLVGDENDWPSAFEHVIKRLDLSIEYGGQTHQVDTSRVRIGPFPLNAPTRFAAIIDRLGYWHYSPREWLKKSALLNDTYLLNNPFTFQSMEKHSAYCAMMRLGLNIPETWLIPQKEAPTGMAKKYQVTAERYHDMFDLHDIAHEIGYPLYMKPFDGGGWRGVSQIDNDYDLMRAYDESGQSLMHLQKGLADYEVFVRSLAIGPQVMSFRYDPSQPMHGRYVIDHGFLTPEQGRETTIITKTINSFFRWDFNSCESIVKDGVLYPIDFANATPDVAVTSLHYYFPWAIKALVAWTTFCVVTERPMSVTMDIKPWFDIGDSDRSYDEKLDEYARLANEHLQTDQFYEFRDTHLAHLDEVMLEYVYSADFDWMLIETVRGMFPAWEHDKFIEHFRGLVRLWTQEQVA